MPCVLLDCCVRDCALTPAHERYTAWPIACVSKKKVERNFFSVFSRRIINWKLRVIGQMCGAHAWHEGSGDIKAPTEEKKNLCFTTGRTRKEREGEGEGEGRGRDSEAPQEKKNEKQSTSTATGMRRERKTEKKPGSQIGS